jgi:hypothetical protein
MFIFAVFLVLIPFLFSHILLKPRKSVLLFLRPKGALRCALSVFLWLKQSEKERFRDGMNAWMIEIFGEGGEVLAGVVG